MAAIVAAVVGCHASEPPPPVPVARPQPQLTVPILTPVLASRVETTPDTAREKHVTIDTHGTDQDVRPLLDWVAQVGNFTLVYPQGINRRVRAQINDAPVSVALNALLSAAGLTLEPTTPGAKPPSMPGVVFYQLPVNVDSLSAEAIVKRFGVDRAIADMIVQSRPKP